MQEINGAISYEFLTQKDHTTTCDILHILMPYHANHNGTNLALYDDQKRDNILTSVLPQLSLRDWFSGKPILKACVRCGKIGGDFVNTVIGDCCNRCYPEYLKIVSSVLSQMEGNSL